MITEIAGRGQVVAVRRTVRRAARVGIWIQALAKEYGMKLRGELMGGAGLSLWARRAAGAALIAFDLAVLVSSLVGGP